MKPHSTVLGLVVVLLAAACDNKKTTAPESAAPSPKNAQIRTPHACVDRLLPATLDPVALATASAENPQNRPPPGAPPIAIMRYKKWKPGRILQVRFLGGEPAVIAHVKKVANGWSEVANIQFAFDEAPSADIRIAFKRGGSWSYIGTDAKSIPTAEATMNFGWLDSETDDAEYSRVVLHEFGHALGFIHEHQHPTNDISWDKEAVYAYYAGEPNKWDRATVDRQIFAKYSTQLTQYSAYDATSIMEYPIPKEHTLDGFSVGWNTALSKADKCFASSELAYPKPGVCPP